MQICQPIYNKTSENIVHTDIKAVFIVPNPFYGFSLTLIHVIKIGGTFNVNTTNILLKQVYSI